MVGLVDGFNVIYKIPSLAEFMFQGKLSLGGSGLIRTLNDYADQVLSKKIPSNLRLTSRFIVMMDGKKEQGLDLRQETVRHCQVFYTHELSADALIKQYVRESTTPKHILVITSDKLILRQTKPYGVQQMNSEEFAAILERAAQSLNQSLLMPGEEEEIAFSDEELNYWQKIFPDK